MLRVHLSKATVFSMLICAVILVLQGCVAGAKLTRRYDSATIAPTVQNPDLKQPSLSAFAFEAPKEASKTALKDLTERGQAAMIREVGRLSKDAESMKQALGKPVREAISAQGVIDERKVRRRVVFSVTNNSRTPGNRLHKTDVVLENLVGARFVGWNQFITEYGTVDLATLGSEQSRSLSATLNVDPRGPLFSGQQVSASASGKLTEAIALKERYIKLSGTIQSQKATIHQQGVAGIDLAGNTSVDFDLEMSGDTKSADIFVVGSSGEDLTLTRAERKFINPAREVSATTSLCAEGRIIVRGDRTLMEGDDVAVYHSWGCMNAVGLNATDNSSRLTLVTEEEARVSAWQLVDGRGRKVHLRFNSVTSDLLLVQTQGEAERILLDLIKKKSKGENIQISGRELYFPNAAGRDQVITGVDVEGLAIAIYPLNWTPKQ